MINEHYNSTIDPKSFRKRKKPVKLIVLLFAIALILIFSIIGIVKWIANNRIQEVEVRVYSVAAQVLARQNLVDYFKINGDVIASNLVNVFPDVQLGRLSSYTVKVGQYVNKNQIIGYIDPSQPGVYFAPNPIRSPIAGTIASLPVDIGARVVSSSVLAQIGNLNSLHIEAFVPERLLNRLQLGTNVNIIMPAYPNLPVAGTVSEVAPAVDVNSRTVMIRISIKDIPPQMRSGMFVELNIESNTYEDVLVVPERSIITRGGRHYLFTVAKSEAEARNRGYDPMRTQQLDTQNTPSLKKKNADFSLKNALIKPEIIYKESAPISGWATLIPVELGFRIDGKVIVTGGDVAEDDHIIVSGQSELNNASPVNIIAQNEMTKED
ncbi:efflux RND transporter periplasmic adaptor subunit [Entomospira nematocerorum]|uniref:HlyD family efflux transporter periplasmic adaptor subunit n=1 Tax=Entomospira nematocerorum TaxID=2719987 RepID=A0A968GES6_9SPIO|nr:efflux RND transporter periplasmic adaptor subunit [Entomospira nematocera]NIZ46436.1 HlyD family efflux transporter periplasmic adaptor subunit [Entomospira nematocera]WDI33761.1 efflux RND transporter periplasmic adaptor subunit [Entomospira nematocera]